MFDDNVNTKGERASEIDDATRLPRLCSVQGGACAATTQRFHQKERLVSSAANRLTRLAFHQTVGSSCTSGACVSKSCEHTVHAFEDARLERKCFQKIFRIFHAFFPERDMHLCRRVDVSKSRAARATAPSVSGDDALSPLPLDFLRAVFLRVPVQTRTHCLLVNRAWNALLVDPSFWSVLNLSLSVVPHFSHALFKSVVAKARGCLRDLDVTGHERVGDELFTRALIAAVTANVTSLTNLRASGHWWTANEARQLVCLVPEVEVERA